MKSSSSVRNEAIKGKGILYILSCSFVLGVILSLSASMGICFAQALESESPDSFVFDKSTDILESYSEVPTFDNKSTYIQYQYTDENIIVPLKDELVELRSPNMRVIQLENGQKQYIFYSSDQMILKEDQKWHNLEYATTTIEKFYSDVYYNKEVSKWFIKIVNAQTYGTSAAGDGNIRKDGTWSDVRSATTGDYLNNTVEYHICGGATFNGGSTFEYYHCFFPFNTADLADDTCIASSSFSFVTTDPDTASGDFYLIKGSQADNTNLALGDIDAVEMTALGAPVTISSSKRYVIPMNADGKAFINLTGYTDLVLTDDHDYNNSPPNSRHFNQPYFSDTSGTTNDPYLVIETEACEEEPPAEEEASTTPFSVDGLNYSWDLSIVGGVTEHYESTTTAPDWVEISYYHIPFLVWLIIYMVTTFICSRLFIELLIRFRKK